MKEYIDREALLSDLQEELEYDCQIYTSEQNKYVDFGLKIAVRNVKRQPAADVVPVIHGEWIGDNGNQPYDDYKCSCCNYYTETRNRARLDNYCGNCGAKMDIEMKDENG